MAKIGRSRFFLMVAVATPLCMPVAAPIDYQASNPKQAEGFQAETPKTVIELQQFRQEKSIAIKSRAGVPGVATLINLNPAINAWYLLRVAWKNGGAETVYHLQNPKPGSTSLLLEDNRPADLIIAGAGGRYVCDLFGSDALKSSQLVFQPLCDGRLFLRNAVAGRRTTLESATELFRDHIWGGEAIIDLGHAVLGDARREVGKAAIGTVKAGGDSAALPFPALVEPKNANRLLTSYNLGIGLPDGIEKSGMAAGAWYAAQGTSGVYVSILQPNLIDSAVLQSHKALVPALDNIEADALSYLVAFDLDRFEVAYAIGTDHPRVDWSNRLLDKTKDPKLPGPDGIGTIRPLVGTGMVSPEDSGKTVAAFTSGFKRAHGAFRYGELAQRNRGSHYGFMENGVLLSRLHPGLATILILRDGSLQIKTWTDADNALLPSIKHARQNGVPLIEWDAASRSPVPGRLVGQWGPGNWSGSAESKLRTMRAGAALQKRDGKRFLIYGVFSSATPSAMVRVFQAYRCEYAMLLDMNALEHTYLAVYRRTGSRLAVDHLLKGMSTLDKSTGGEVVPRFLGFADNRDFFYVKVRDNPGVRP